MANASPYPPVAVVDENDNEIGAAPLAEVWQKGLYHRIVSVFIVDEQERMLLQLRGPSVRVYPGRWDQAAGGHVDAGQTYESTAHHELAEELGLHDVTLRTLDTFRTNEILSDGRSINQFERAYAATIASSTPLHPEATEISKLQWFTAAELRTLIGNEPERLTPGVLQVLTAHFPAFQYILI